MDTEAKEEIYDILFNVGDQIIDHYNPCDWRNGKCGRTRLPKTDGKSCCEGCEHLGKNGCAVKSLACKLWLCEDQSILFKECLAELKVLRMVADYCGVPHGERKSKEQDFGRLNRESRNA